MNTFSMDRVAGWYPQNLTGPFSFLSALLVCVCVWGVSVLDTLSYKYAC